MPFRKLFLSKILGSFFLVAIVASALFLGGARAEAASASWTYVLYTPADNSCLYDSTFQCYPAYYSTVATFYASTNKDTYAPGESIPISLAATIGDTGPVITNILDVAGNVISTVACWFGLSCSSPPIVGVSARFDSSGFVISQDGAGSVSLSGSFNAPTTPGTYAISLSGCWADGSHCSGSSIAITVSAPPSVFLQFSFLDKVKSMLSDPAHLFNGVGKS